MQPGWTAIIVNYNGEIYLDGCLRALRKQRRRPAATIVVDNASTDESCREMIAFPEVDLLELPQNRGYAGGANAGLTKVETELAVIFNPDVEPEPGFGTALCEAFRDQPDMALAGALLLYPDGKTVQHAGGVVRRPGLETDHLGRGEPLDEVQIAPREIDFATGAALGIRMAALWEVSGFDEQFMPAYYEDVDLSYRMRAAGWSVRLAPEMRAIHYEGVTLERSPAYYQHLHRNRLRFALKHLSPAEWQRDFVPAEFERLSYEIEHLTDDSSLEQTGASAVEHLLRSWRPAGDWDLEPILTDDPAPVDQAELARLHRYRQLDLADERGRQPGLLKRLAFNLIPGARAEALARQQRAFNDAVTRALEAENRAARRQTAQLLLLALQLIERLERLADETADAWDRDVPTKIDPSGPDGAWDERQQEDER